MKIPDKVKNRIYVEDQMDLPTQNKLFCLKF